ncbi:MAG: dihydroorotate dehydrogenase-like protein [Chlorobi bacterium]|nr:dihydroorotate dehydrogenase-like protein [Chlorobiota bacterium]
MTDLKINYLGLQLKNPIIVGASNLSTDINMLKKLEEAGASAFVYKSLFEEQIQLEEHELDESLDEYVDRHPEMINMFPNINHAGPAEFLLNFKKAKEAVNMPIIASLNAVYSTSWLDYAKKLEEAGADAIELNFYAVPKKSDVLASAIEDEQLEILKEVKQNIKIPVSVKLSPYYSNPLNIIHEMDKIGIDSFVLFNRLFQPDIDIENEKLSFPYNLSNESDNKLALRFAGLLYGNINAKVCANTGIFTGQDAIKMILAGADAIQIVSTIYKNGANQIRVILSEIEKWMDEKGYKTIDDFKGKLSKKNLNDPFAYKRAQYVDILMHSDNIFKRYPMK